MFYLRTNLAGVRSTKTPRLNLKRYESLALNWLMNTPRTVLAKRSNRPENETEAQYMCIFSSNRNKQGLKDCTL